MYFELSVRYLFAGLILSSVTLAAPTASEVPTIPRPCATIIESQEYNFTASLAYACLKSVPFNPAVASRFLSYYNDTIQFQSTLACLKSPPSSYQQPSVDLLKGLQDLKDAVQKGVFPDQYEFEAALQRLVYAAHDSHLYLSAGILAAFTFSSPLDIVSLSLDGLQLPRVYLSKDYEESQYFKTFTPSPIASINGANTNAYLSKFASESSAGMLEPHADWNRMMKTAAGEIQRIPSVFTGGTPLYPGHDTITFVLENGTKVSEPFIAQYNSQGNPGPLETGGDFFNFFVLGQYPASYNQDLINNNNVNMSYTSTVNATFSDPLAGYTAVPISESDLAKVLSCKSSWDNPAYPECANVSQINLETGDIGLLAGYYLPRESIGVLSLPSFDVEDSAVDLFDSTISDFLTGSRNASLKKIVIDVQSNFGGQSLLAIATFKHFFPNIDPFVGSRMRAHHAANRTGDAIDRYFKGLGGSDEISTSILVSSEWVSSTHINANTDKNFTSWQEFYGPISLNGDTFTNIERYDLSNTRFDSAAIDSSSGNFTVFGYGPNKTPLGSTPPYAAEDIILLSDGICSSACSLFMEMMHHEAGVRVVVAGGAPKNGPMQAPGGNRGAARYSTDELDAFVDFAQLVLQSEGLTDNEVNFLPNRTEAKNVYVSYASINLRDQIRRDETIPRQFAYEAADCRIFFTPQTASNYTALWKYAADSIWGPKDLCVPGSKGYATTGTNKTDFDGPFPSAIPGSTSVQDIVSHLTYSNAPSSKLSIPDSEGLEDAPPDNPITANIIECKTTADCKGYARSVCALLPTCVPGNVNAEAVLVKQCAPECIKGADQCGPRNGHCSFGKYFCPVNGPCRIRRASIDAVTLIDDFTGQPYFHGVLGFCVANYKDCSKKVPIIGTPGTAGARVEKNTKS